MFLFKQVFSLIKYEFIEVLRRAFTQLPDNYRYDITVVLGDYDLTKDEGTEQVIAPSMVIPHPQYNSYTKENDIMIIKLSV